MPKLKESIPEDIDKIATAIVRMEFGPDDDTDWETYLAIAKAIKAERERCMGIIREMGEDLKQKLRSL